MNEQIALIDAESDHALLMPLAELRKRYTAVQAQKIEWRRDSIRALLACNLPIEEVAKVTHTNERTVKEILGIFAASIAEKMGQYADYAMGRSAKFLALAELKAHEAPFKDLISASSFIGKMALDMKLANAVAGDIGGESDAIEAESESVELRLFREGLKQLAKVPA